MSALLTAGGSCCACEPSLGGISEFATVFDQACACVQWTTFIVVEFVTDQRDRPEGSPPCGAMSPSGAVSLGEATLLELAVT